MNPIQLKTLTYLFIGLFSVISCTDDPSVTSPAPAAITFEVLTDNLGAAPRSRAYNDLWEVGDRVGIFMLSASAGTWAERTLAANYPYTTTNPQESHTATLAADGQQLYYPANRSAVNFVAYYPYTASGVNATTGVYSVNVGGTTAQILKNLDLLYHTDADGVSYNTQSGNATLAFTHKLAKICISVKPGPGINVDLSASPKLTFVGMPAQADFYLNTETLTNRRSITTTITPAPVGTPGAALAEWEAIIIPQDPMDNRKLTFTLGGTEYVYTLPKSDTFKSGMIYTYNFLLTTAGIALDKNSVQDWNGGTLAWGNDKLTIEQTTLNITDAGTSVQTGNAPSLTLSTTATNATFLAMTSLLPDAETGEKPNWIKGATLTAGTTANGWKPYTLNFTCSQNYFNTSRTAYILVETTNGLSMPITVTQAPHQPATTTVDGMANCYIVFPGETLEFPARRAFDCTLTTDSEQLRVDGSPYTGELAVEVLWEDNSGLITSATVVGNDVTDRSGANAIIRIETNKKQLGMYGNALVKLYKATDSSKTAIWSYHIWVPNTTLAPHSGWKPATLNCDVLDRDLGAISGTATDGAKTYGLFYQGGRKDPFRRMSVSSEYRNTYRQSMSWTISNPTMYICVTGANWLSESNSDPWGNVGDKTLYDPCPQGWRVGRNDFWPAGDTSGKTDSGFSWDATNKGSYLYGTWFPASGFLKHFDTGGTLMNVGTTSSHHCARSVLNKVAAFDFSSTTWSPHDGGNGYGRAVRCMKEN